MIHFPLLQTQRLTVQLQELTFKQALELAAMPVNQYEASITKFLEFAVKSVVGVENSLDWTVQERILSLTHYLSCTNEEENADFSLDDGSYYDYLDIGKTAIGFEPVAIGNIGDDEWFITHLTGEFAQAIERTESMLLKGCQHWLIGTMASCLRLDNEVLQFENNAELDQWLLNRMETFINYPDLDFDRLYTTYRYYWQDFEHIFSIEFNDNGIVVLPRETEGNLPPARFRVLNCLSRTAIELSGIHYQSSSESYPAL